MWHINDPLSVTEGGTMEAKRLKETKHIKAHHYMSKILWTSVHNQTSCHSWLESFWIKVRTFAFTRRQAVFVFSTLVLFSILNWGENALGKKTVFDDWCWSNDSSQTWCTVNNEGGGCQLLHFHPHTAGPEKRIGWSRWVCERWFMFVLHIFYFVF